MLLPTYINSNKGGIPSVSSNSVTVTTTGVQYAFNNHFNFGGAFRGLIVVRLEQAIPTGTTTTLPIIFTTPSGNDKTLTTYNGADVTVADISGTGIYLCWCDPDVLQLIK